MAARFVIAKSSNGKFHFVLKAGNNETILQSTMYETPDAAKQAIGLAKTAAASDANFSRETSKKSEPYFSLKSGGQQVGRSEMYSSERARDNGIESVKKNAPTAPIDDQSAAA